EDLTLVVESEEALGEEYQLRFLFDWGKYNAYWGFQFYHVIDLRKMLSSGPWLFNNYILLIHRLLKGENPELVEFYHVYFLVQVSRG
ncbi:hypothetical protein Gohar_015158, partial [Gossypium harknessii]|nr:hypothetical protein [Gossypium harknessii]